MAVRSKSGDLTGPRQVPPESRSRHLVRELKLLPDLDIAIAAHTSTAIPTLTAEAQRVIDAVHTHDNT